MSETVWIPRLVYGIASLGEVTVEKRTAAFVYVERTQASGYERRFDADDVFSTREEALARLRDDAEIELDRLNRMIQSIRSTLGMVARASAPLGREGAK